MKTDQTAKVVQDLAEKWCPPAKTQEFLKDVGDVIVVAINECTDYLLIAERAAKAPTVAGNGSIN